MNFAIEEDIEELSQIRLSQQQSDWKDEYQNIDNFELRTKLYLKNHLNKDLFILIEKQENKIVATCGLQIIEYLPQCNDNGLMGYICNVYTSLPYRNKGIQTKLLKQCIEFAKSKSISELQLSTDNPLAIKIYKKLHFEYDNLIMKLDLSKKF